MKSGRNFPRFWTSWISGACWSRLPWWKTAACPESGSALSGGETPIQRVFYYDHYTVRREIYGPFCGCWPRRARSYHPEGAQLLGEADCVIYAGSLVNPALLAMTREGASIYNSAQMTLEQVLAVIKDMEQSGKTTVRLHTGDPCLYGAIQEQMDQLDELGISWDVTPVCPPSAGLLLR